MPAERLQKERCTRKLTYRQRQYVDYLSDPDTTEPPAAFAQRIGVKPDTLNRWKANPVIVQAVFQLCVTRLGAEMPKVLKMLQEKSLIDRDVSACKLFFQQLDKITEIPEAGMTVDEALRLIDNALHRHEDTKRRDDDGDAPDDID